MNGSAKAVALIVGLAVVTSMFPVGAAAYLEYGWSRPVRIETDQRGDTGIPRAAYDGAGNALVVWPQFEGARWDGWAERYDALLGWQGPVLVEEKDGNVTGMRVAVHRGGNATVVWNQERDATNWTVHASTYHGDFGWNQVDVNLSNSESAVQPDVAAGGAGRFMVVWTERIAGRWQIAAVLGGITFGSYGGPIDAGTCTVCAAPKVAGDDAGNFLAAWENENASGAEVWAARYTPAGGWGAPARVDGDATYSASQPEITVDPAGNATLAWTRTNASATAVHGARWTASANWSGPVNLMAGVLGVGDFPQVGADGAGNVFAAWRVTANATNTVFAARYVAGSGWGAAVAMSLLPYNTSGPRLSVGRDGTAYIAFQYVIYGISPVVMKWVVGDWWAYPMFLEDDPLGYSNIPRVAAGPSGQAMVVWSQFDGAVQSLWASVFSPPDTTPPPLVIVTPVSSITTIEDTVLIAGTTEPGASVSVGGVQAAVDLAGLFSVRIPLAVGFNAIDVVARDPWGLSTSAFVGVTRDASTGSLDGLNAALNQTRAELNATKAALTTARADFNATAAQLDTLASAHATTQAELDATQAELDSTRLQLNTTKFQLTGAQEDVDQAVAMASNAQREAARARSDANASTAQLQAQQGQIEQANRTAEAARSQAAFATAMGLAGVMIGAIGVVCAVVMSRSTGGRKPPEPKP